MADTPPGLDGVASVTVRIPGFEDVTIVGKILNLSLSMSNIDVSPPTEIVEPPVKFPPRFPSAT